MTSFERSTMTADISNDQQTFEIAEIAALYEALDSGYLRRNDIVVISSELAEEMDLVETVSNLPFRTLLVHLSSISAEKTELLENAIDHIVDLSKLQVEPRETLNIIIEQLTQAGNRVLFLNLLEKPSLNKL